MRPRPVWCVRCAQQPVSPWWAGLELSGSDRRENGVVIVDCALYEDGVRRPGELQVGECHLRVHDGKSFIWVGLFEPTEAEFAEVRAVFQLHPLAVEDALKAHQMPKLELYDESVFLVLKTARYLDEVEEVEFGEIQVFIGDGFLVHVRHGEASPLRLVRKDAEHHPELLGCGPSAVLHAITDHVVDSYEPVIAGLENDVHEVEMEVFSGEGHNPVERIYFLKREVLQVHAALSPLVPVLHQLAHRRVEFVHENMQEYFRDVYDHLVRTVDKVNQFSDMLSSVLAANLTQVGVRQNQDMRKIAAWAAILAVPTALAGVYGMNFDHMPELGWHLGYPAALATMVLVCILMYRKFRSIGWL